MALTGSEEDLASPRLPLTRLAVNLYGRIKSIVFDGSDRALAHRLAGTAFLVRAFSALLAFGSQILLARWMGGYEFGIYVYAWTWVVLVGGICAFGFGSSAQRFIPEYIEHKQSALLRGFLSGSRWIVLGGAGAFALAAAGCIRLADGLIDPITVVPLYFACLCFPLHALLETQSGISRSFDWVNLALLPPFVLRQILLIALMGAAYALALPTDAVTAMLVTFATLAMVVVGQVIELNRRLGRVVERGPKTHAPRVWLATSLPIFLVEGFYLLLTYTDVLVLQQFRSPDEVAIYYAAAKTLAPVAFIYFAVAQTTAHKFTEFHVLGDRERLTDFLAQSIKMTFWPSLACGLLLLAFGRPLLGLFGAGFSDGYHLMFILIVGMLARAAVGPIERLLNMLGQQRACAIVYAGAFALNVVLCVVLIPLIGVAGAAVATATALIVESIALFFVTRNRLGFHGLIFGRAKRH